MFYPVTNTSEGDQLRLSTFVYVVEWKDCARHAKIERYKSYTGIKPTEVETKI
jgi:hypothetical protein